MNINYKHLKKMRELSGLTQVQLGELLGLNLIPSTKNTNRFECPQITWVETGRKKKIDFEFAKRWANHCGFEILSDIEIKVSTDSYFKLIEESEKYQSILKTIHE